VITALFPLAVLYVVPAVEDVRSTSEASARMPEVTTCSFSPREVKLSESGESWREAGGWASCTFTYVDSV
jgi:hypothetical protein